MRGNRRKTSMEWPADVDDRLRLLVRLAEQDGELRATSASELLAALICNQPLDGARLAAVINAYRQDGSGVPTPGAASDEPPQPRRRGRPRRGRAKDAEQDGGTRGQPGR